MIKHTLMVQGCTSDAGKSALVTGLCRWLARQEIPVAPFKPQNMALNSAVTPEGGEIGRAQAVQAQACFLPTHTDMNPVLLKPNSDQGSQIILQGHSIGNMEALTYHAYKPIIRTAVLESFSRLRDRYTTLIIEGAGSPAEINLREGDIANMGFAETVDCPVILVADIDRGGVFAHLVGTLALLSESEQARIKGFVINRFRGDIALLQPGLDWLEKRTGKPVLGVLPYLHGLVLEAEDALPHNTTPSKEGRLLKVVVPILPRISNHTDFDSLRLHPALDFHFCPLNESPPPADIIILPGTKNVRSDLASLRQHAWEPYLQRHLRYGGRILGICGGFQMLGKAIHDPAGIEGSPGSSEGLGLLDIETTLKPNKQLKNVTGTLIDTAIKVSGYEIHAGITTGASLNRPLLQLQDNADGAVSEDRQIMGTYVHGLFDQPEATDILLGLNDQNSATCPDIRDLHEKAIDRLADAIEQHLDTTALRRLLHLQGESSC